MAMHRETHLATCGWPEDGRSGGSAPMSGDIHPAEGSIHPAEGRIAAQRISAVRRISTQQKTPAAQRTSEPERLPAVRGVPVAQAFSVIQGVPEVLSGSGLPGDPQWVGDSENCGSERCGCLESPWKMDDPGRFGSREGEAVTSYGRPATDRGTTTAEYAIVTMAAVGFAGLLAAILRSGEVRGLLLGLVHRALGAG